MLHDPIRIFARWLSLTNEDRDEDVIFDEIKPNRRAQVETQYGGKISVYGIDWQGVGELVVFTGLDEQVETIVHSFDGTQNLIVSNQKQSLPSAKEMDGLFYAV